MQEAYININDIPTHIMTWGKWIEESFTADMKEVVICITGNPGLPGFYTQFMSTIHQNIDSNIPVWVIGHAGHDDPPQSSILQVPLLQDNEDKFNLKGQIKHKIDFIETYVPKGVKIHLIGHSIGAWMILELLKIPEINERIQKCYMLFPTLEKMVESPNGKRFTNFCIPFLKVILLLLRLLYKIPLFIKIFIIYVYFWFSSIPNFYIGTAVKYSKPAVIERAIFLANDEMATVRNLDIPQIKNNIKLLKFYFGTTDGWVPISYYNNLKEKVPNADAILDNKHIEHAFVLRSSKLMGNILADWIKQYSVNN